MKTLILMRHAKSDWSDPLQQDHDRTLNDRGRRSADAIGAWLAGKGHLPDALLSSTAERTKQTWACVARHLPKPERTEWNRDLYLASSMGILRALHKATGDTVLLLAHNDGIGEAAGLLVRDPPHHPRFLDYPTAATTVMRFDIDDWDAGRWGGGTLVDFTVPRDLGID